MHEISQKIVRLFFIKKSLQWEGQCDNALYLIMINLGSTCQSFTLDFFPNPTSEYDSSILILEREKLVTRLPLLPASFQPPYLFSPPLPHPTSFSYKFPRNYPLPLLRPLLPTPTYFLPISQHLQHFYNKINKYLKHNLIVSWYM